MKFRAPGDRVAFEVWTRALKRGTAFKKRYFAVIGSSTVKTVADMYRRAAYHNKHRWRDF